MAGNARRGPHCIGIVFLCQEWRLWGLFFAGRNFGMKLMLSPIRQNVFLVAHHSAFLELSTLQKGPIVPFSVTTPLFGCNGRFGGARRRCVCSLRVLVACLAALSLVVCDPPPPLMLVAFPCRSLLCACVTPPRRSLADVCYSLIAACRIFVASPAALTPSKRTLHFAVTCVSRS